MTFASRITRLPRAYEPDRAQEALRATPWATGPVADLIAGAAGSAPYLHALIEKEAAWLEGALAAPEAALADVMSAAEALAPDQVKSGLRRAKRRVALITALADLAGVWALYEVTGHLSLFADRACRVALRAAILREITRGKLPGQTEDDLDTAAGMVVMAMGKLGAGELNYSSDIDLICLFDETRFDRDDFHAARAGFVRATRTMSNTLSDLTGEGYVFRTDLRLRPDPAVTPVCIAMEAAERYYESLGRTWERAAYIKARPAAGDIAAGYRFLQHLRPFVWRKHLDFAAIEDAHDMRLRIRAHKGLGGPITLPGHNMKLGRGGIREIEFFTQTRQIIAGGRDPDLRLRGTVDGLNVLAAKGWVPSDVASTLVDHYAQHREVEHRVQMIRDAQTHDLPKSDAGFDRLAHLMGLDTAALQADLLARLTAVHGLTDGFFAPDTEEVETPSTLAESDIPRRWPSYPALRSDRAAAIFRRLRPEILQRLAQTARPEQSLAAFDAFLQGLPAGVQLFSLFEANPQLVDLLIDIVGVSPDLGRYLSQNAAVFDAVLGGDFFADWPGGEVLQHALATELKRAPDYEAKLDTARRWAKEWHFRVGVHLLRGLMTAVEAGHAYAELAEASLAALWPVVLAEFVRKHGDPPGRGAAVLGMGSLGAGRLHSRSDLDLIVIYDPETVETSAGQRPLATRPYYARLTQALITAVSAPMAEGRLYEIDMRLRPSGHQGPVATSWVAFQSYQQQEAWVWEHLALTRARAVAGSAALGADLEAFRAALLDSPRAATEVLREVAAMRARIANAKGPPDPWDPKLGPGRMQDIELLGQAAALVSTQTPRSTREGIISARDLGWLSADEMQALHDTYGLLWALQIGGRLIRTDALVVNDLGQDGLGFLLRLTETPDLADLSSRLDGSTRRAAAIIERVLAEHAAT